MHDIGSSELPSHPSPPAQVLRGIGWTALILFGIGVLAWVAGYLDEVRTGPHWKAIPLIAAGGMVSWVSVRRVRRWTSRPRWLLPTCGVVLACALVPAVWPVSVHADVIGIECTPMLDAWRPVVARPSEADMRVLMSTFAIPAPNVFRDSVQRRSYIDSVLRTERSPAYLRAARFVEWAASSDACAPISRRLMLVSGSIVLAGALLIGAGLVKRGRRVGASS